MGIFSKNAPGQLIGNCLSYHGSPSVHQRLDYPCGGFSRIVARFPVGVPSPRDMASYIKDIFGREAQAGQRPLCGSPEVGITLGITP
jgi:hypothetical protein